MAEREIVVVSTHLDDAVLSASRQLLRPCARLVTVCAGEPAEDAPLGEWDRLTGATGAAQRVRERYAEDDVAASALGVTDVVRLGIPDDQHVARADRPSLETVVAAVRPQLAGAAEIWAPAGIGCHPDHLATRDAVIQAAADLGAAGAGADSGDGPADGGPALHFYADVPYSVRYGWPTSVTGRPPFSPYVDVELWLALELAGSGLADRLGTALDRSVHPLDDEHQRRKVSAMAGYVTQIPILDLGDMLAGGDPAVIGFEVSWSRS